MGFCEPVISGRAQLGGSGSESTCDYRHVVIRVGIAEVLKQEGADWAFFSLHVASGPLHLASPFGLPLGAAWSPQDTQTAYMAAQGCKQVFKRTRQTLCHFS